MIHFLAQYYRLLHKAYADWGERADAKLDRATYHQALMDAVAYTHSPIFISAATTMAGFGAFIFSGIPAIRDLGIFATVGVFLSYWFCVLLGAVVSLVFPHPTSQPVARRRRQPPTHISGEACPGSIFIGPAGSTPFQLCPPCGQCGGCSIFKCIPTIFPTSTRMHPWCKRPGFFTNGWPGIAPLFVVVESKGERKVTEPDVLKATEALQRERSGDSRG